MTEQRPPIAVSIPVRGNYLRNCWYVSAVACEVGRDLLARTLLDEPIVLFRKLDGAPVALEDRCSHRFYPLSKGDLKGDVVVCGYHGLEFNCEGSCVRVPAQDRVPKNADIRSYPVIERWSLVWVWMGQPELADPALIPALWTNEHPEWELVIGPTFFVNADYRLLADNLLDSSHVTFLHKTTLGTAAVAEIPHQTDVSDKSVAIRRWTLDSPPPPMFAKFGRFTTNVDRWQINTFTPPFLTQTDIGCCVAGTGAQEGDRTHGVEMLVHNIATPSTSESFYYFWCHTRKFALGDSAMSALIVEQVSIALKEDIRAIEGVHAGLKRFADRVPVDIRADGAGLRGRRMLSGLIARESNAPARQATPQT